MSKIYAIIQEAVIASLEKSEKLPMEFVIELEDQHFQELIKDLVIGGTKTPVSKRAKRVVVEIAERRIVIRSDQDPQDWFADPAETVH